MENKSILDEDLNQEFILNSQSKNNFIRAAKWAKFVAISLFIGTFWMIYQFVQMIIASQYSRSRNHLDLNELVVVLIYISLIIFTFFAAYNLLSFANRAILGLEKNNNKIFAISIESLRSYFKFYGLFTLLIAIFSFLFFYAIYIQITSQGDF